YGLGLVSQVTPGGSNYYQFDAQGSTAGVTNASSGLVASYDYLPFGGLVASTGSVSNPFTYMGQWGVTSDGSGLYGLGARSYDPTTGDFVSVDPLGISGGGMNPRQYVGNSPVSANDPLGLLSFGGSINVNSPGIQQSFNAGLDTNGSFAGSLDTSVNVG